MNRKNEFAAMIEELNQPVPGLETTLVRAYKKKSKRTAKMILRPLAGIAACFAFFVLLVNFSAPVAYACSQIPVLRELVAAVTFSKSLSVAVENEYAQHMDLSQTQNGITAEIDYLIVDQKQVNIFYRLDSDTHDQLLVTPRAKDADSQQGLSVIVSQTGLTDETGVLRCLTVDFVEDTIPDSMVVELNVYDGDPDEYMARFEFLLEFDPEFTAAGKIFPVNQKVILDGQVITITDIEVYPTHMRVDIEEAPDNTAWLKDLDFYIETDMGMKFDPVSGGITATGSGDSPTMTSYRADSTYFYESEHLKLVITGAQWLRKDMQTTYLNLVTGEHGDLPEGVQFDSARKQGNDWIVKFRADWDGISPMHQCFGSKFYDAEGTMFEANWWSTIVGEEDENGNISCFYEEFPLPGFSGDEVWLSPHYSYYWTAKDLIVIPVH